MARKFKEPVDVVLYGDTHEEIITYWDGIMIMNPGSPTYPGKRHKRGVLGTIGILEGDGKAAIGRIVELDPTGLISTIYHKPAIQSKISALNEARGEYQC